MAAIADLAEAEGRLLRKHAQRLAVGLALLVGAALAGLAGLCLLMASLYMFVAAQAGHAVAALACGAALAVVAGILAWMTRSVSR